MKNNVFLEIYSIFKSKIMKKFIKILCSGVLASSILLSSVNVFANQVVRVSIGSTKASVNGQSTTLSIAPYIQQL